MTTEAVLGNFFAAYQNKAWNPSTVNCCLYLAAWAIWIGHCDPARHLRGFVCTEQDYMDLIESRGGLVPIVSECVEVIGGIPATFPLCGDVAVIGSEKNIHRQWGAIFDGNRWIIRTRDGLSPMSARPLAIWKI